MVWKSPGRNSQRSATPCSAVLRRATSITPSRSLTTARPLGAGLQHGDRPGRPSRAKVEDAGRGQRAVAHPEVGAGGAAPHGGERPLHQRHVEGGRIVVYRGGGPARAHGVGQAGPVLVRAGGRRDQPGHRGRAVDEQVAAGGVIELEVVDHPVEQTERHHRVQQRLQVQRRKVEPLGQGLRPAVMHGGRSLVQRLEHAQSPGRPATRGSGPDPRSPPTPAPPRGGL